MWIWSKEINIFEATGKPNESLNSIYSAIMTTKPTSIESEKTFSAAVLSMGKIRSRLSDKLIDCLCFLKHFFNSNNTLG